jgi:hypothetical protein
LTTAQFIFGEQECLNRFGMGAGAAYPIQDRVFFDVFHPTDTADAHPFSDHGETLDDFAFWGLAIVEDRPCSLAERSSTFLAAIPLPPLPAIAKFDDIRFCLLRLAFPVERTSWIWTKIAHLG